MLESFLFDPKRQSLEIRIKFKYDKIYVDFTEGLSVVACKIVPNHYPFYSLTSFRSDLIRKLPFHKALREHIGHV